MSMVIQFVRIWAEDFVKLTLCSFIMNKTSLKLLVISLRQESHHVAMDGPELTVKIWLANSQRSVCFFSPKLELKAGFTMPDLLLFQDTWQEEFLESTSESGGLFSLGQTPR